jgi:hypothetical protein
MDEEDEKPRHHQRHRLLLGMVCCGALALGIALGVGLGVGLQHDERSKGGVAPLPPPAAAPGPAASTTALNFALCIENYTQVQLLSYRARLLNGTGTYLGVPEVDVTLLNISIGCTPGAAPAARRRHRRLLLVASSPPPPSPPPLGWWANATGGNDTAYNTTDESVMVSLQVSIPSGSSAAAVSALQATVTAIGTGSNAASQALASALTSAGMPGVSASSVELTQLPVVVVVVIPQQASAALALAGYTMATFTASMRSAFVAGVASAIAEPAASVAIISVVDVPAARRRALLTVTEVEVTFSCATQNASLVATLARLNSSLPAEDPDGSIAALEDVFQAAFVSAGMSVLTDVRALLPPRSAPPPPPPPSPPPPSPPPPPVPPTGTVGGIDYCASTKANMDAAFASGGVCASCASSTGAARGCAMACPACVNTIDDYLASCAGDFARLNFGVLEAYAGALALTDDCLDWLSVASRPYAAAYCGDAFDHIVQYAQSAALHSVVVVGGAMTAPSYYSCLASNASVCLTECQADLDLLAAACHATDSVRWDGNGLPGYLTSSGAPAGTSVTPADAFALFANGTAAVPTNLVNGVASSTPLPLSLGACGNATGQYPFYSPPPPSPSLQPTVLSPSPPPPSPSLQPTVLSPPSAQLNPPPPSPPPPPVSANVACACRDIAE